MQCTRSCKVGLISLCTSDDSVCDGELDGSAELRIEHSPYSLCIGLAMQLLPVG